MRIDTPLVLRKKILLCALDTAHLLENYKRIVIIRKEKKSLSQEVKQQLKMLTHYANVLSELPHVSIPKLQTDLPPVTQPKAMSEKEQSITKELEEIERKLAVLG